MENPDFEYRLIFPFEHWHNHSSCIVEMPGDSAEFRACWYRGSGERRSDDVHVCGARLYPGSDWSPLPTLADTPGFPDTNPFMMVDARNRWWVFYGTQIDNRWESTLLKFRRSDPFGNILSDHGLIHLKPDDDAFQETVDRLLPMAYETALATLPDQTEKLKAYIAAQKERSRDKLSRRIGWMGRCRPLVEGARIFLPLYSDGFDFSLIAISEDHGETWHASLPMIGPGAVQPSLLRRRDGTLVAFCRNNGPEPNKVLVSESHDNGYTWTVARPGTLPNHGSSVDGLVLKDGRWLLCYNDTPNSKRNSLVVALSEDEGGTWQPPHIVERAEPGVGSFAYPSVLQARNGDLHITYTCTREGSDVPTDVAGRPQRETIKHARLSHDRLKSWK
ncbi:MAG: exo-alpha-sialidase [Capsulimonadales bacterium]|nr:exo-alpha-sialidase [Capsulimonadales bacterium]